MSVLFEGEFDWEIQDEVLEMENSLMINEEASTTLALPTVDSNNEESDASIDMNTSSLPALPSTSSEFIKVTYY